MKRAKILIHKTVSGDMKYNVYRFKNEAAKTRLEDYLDLDPIETLDENESNVEVTNAKGYIPTITDNGDEYEYVVCSLPFEFLYKSNVISFNIGSGKTKEPERIIEVHFGKVSINEIICKKAYGDTYTVEFSATNSSEISKVVVVESPSAIAINKKYIEEFTVITLDINIAMIPYIDRTSNGIYKPEYKVVERLKDYEVHPVKESQENIYYYTVLGIDKSSKISDVSNIAPIRLAENPHSVTTIIECSDDYYRDKENATWEKFDETKASSAYKFSKDDLYTREIPGINVNEIKADDSNVETLGERIIKFPNIWHRDKLNLSYRENRAYRMINKYKNELSEPSNVIHIDGYSKVNIDKMVIYKKKVTYISESDRNKPIKIGDSNAELLKVYVRVGGIFYADAVNKLENQPIELVSDNSRLPLLQIKDHCLYSNHYNYTVYLYDEKGKKSKPYVIVL